MKNIIISFVSLMLFAIGFIACDRSESLSSTSVIIDKHAPKNELDTWLDENYRRPYNINFIYRLEDGESDRKYNLDPADYAISGRVAKIVKHVWFGAYDEVAGKAAFEGSNVLKGEHFMRNYSPRVIHLIGSNAYNSGSRTLGTAEGGLKVVLYAANLIEGASLEELNEVFFHTLHHEFAHILHQTHEYPVEYETLSAGHYVPTSWINRQNIKEYAPLGFVTAYAGSQGREDIAEVTAGLVTFSDATWERIKKAAGDKGWRLIEQKIELVKQYMREFYGIDMDELRKVVSRRGNEIGLLLDPVIPLNPSLSVITPRQKSMALDCELLFSLPRFNLTNVLNSKPSLHVHKNGTDKCCNQ